MVYSIGDQKNGDIVRSFFWITIATNHESQVFMRILMVEFRLSQKCKLQQERLLTFDYLECTGHYFSHEQSSRPTHSLILSICLNSQCHAAVALCNRQAIRPARARARTAVLSDTLFTLKSIVRNLFDRRPINPFALDWTGLDFRTVLLPLSL
jgi:hypothetical protein